MQHHNPSNAPGALIGHRRNGQPIHLIAGASGEGEGDPAPVADPPAQPPAPPAPAPAPEPAPPAEPPAPGAPSVPTDVSQLPDWAQKLLTDTRTEAANNRVKLREAETVAQSAKAAADAVREAQEQQRDALAKALGYGKEDTPPDPKELAEQLVAAKAETDARIAEKREADVKLAVYIAAGKHDANAVALVDSLSFQRSVKDLDPSAPDFADRLGEAITKAVEANPLYKVAAPAAPKAPVKAKSGGEFSGAPGGNRQWTDEDVASHSPAQVAKAIEDGLLVDMGFNPTKPRR